ncbi:Pycsar system effector family protein [Aureimonas leprariae]|uniref:Pycsar effector protein domain-containing protein n=1 Tax=Plantimonas leprariae TaxID=2615207 RepID=A0A7V7PSH0_9HYPH|nr:Pycsar system effector family protein [Aureimonas leprariae]KAB0682047.1 hypothetical protein F6X38_04400 [Aureimonas leprariae]
MAKDDQQDSFEKLLSTHHGRMIDFVKFAETKNAALLTFCSVWIGAIIGLLRAPDKLPMNYDKAFLAVLPILFVAALLTLRSFLPRFLHHHHHSDEDGSKNLLYFGDIASLKTDQYIHRIRERYYPPDGSSCTERYLDDLAVQVSVQSQIALRKFKTFTRAGCLVLAAFAILALPIIHAAVSAAARYALMRGWI